jgi:hypothetical protein
MHFQWYGITLPRLGGWKGVCCLASPYRLKNSDIKQKTIVLVAVGGGSPHPVFDVAFLFDPGGGVDFFSWTGCLALRSWWWGCVGDHSTCPDALLCDYKVQGKFCVWLVVWVTQNFSLERVLLLLISLERRAEIPFPPEAMATLISRKLSGAGGDYLILLDDLWSDKQGKWLEIWTLMKGLQ